MFGLLDSTAAHGRTMPVTIGPGGLAPVVVLAGIFGAFGAWVGVPVAMAALVGGIGGTASLLVHELGHVRAARRSAGIRSAAVSLIWLGAATRLEGRYESGREQARVAIAGPRASFALAAALLAAVFLPMPFAVKELVLVLVLLTHHPPHWARLGRGGAPFGSVPARSETASRSGGCLDGRELLRAETLRGKASPHLERSRLRLR